MIKIQSRLWQRLFMMGTLVCAVSWIRDPSSQVRAEAHPAHPASNPSFSSFQGNSDAGLADAFDDGTPNFLRLHDPADRDAFRRWFTFLAMRAASLPADKLPAEIQDCAGLLRYAYREALKPHTEAWLHDSELAQGSFDPLPTSIAQYHSSQTPLGPALFRTRAGSFRPSDISDQTFLEFADAKTLMLDNSHFVTRDIHRALSGDILFFRQFGQDSQYHSMIVVRDEVAGRAGSSAGPAAEWLIYHTGPIGKHKGEMRRVLVEDLLHHPDARWRPDPSNPNFLGVYRWNILREDG